MIKTYNFRLTIKTINPIIKRKKNKYKTWKWNIRQRTGFYFHLFVSLGKVIINWHILSASLEFPSFSLCVRKVQDKYCIDASFRFLWSFSIIGRILFINFPYYWCVCVYCTKLISTVRNFVWTQFKANDLVMKNESYSKDVCVYEFVALILSVFASQYMKQEQKRKRYK